MTAAEQEQQSVRATTEYVVLMQDVGGEWRRAKLTVGSLVVARDAVAAVRHVVEKMPDIAEGATFVAIPARSWKPMRVKTETVTSLTIEDAT